MTETKHIAIVLDAEQAKAGLRDVKKLEHEVDEAGAGMGERLEEGFEKAHHSSRHLAGGINALSSAFGDSTGEIGKMVREAGHIAGLAGIIGPVGTAVAAVTFTVGMLAEHFGGVGEAAKKAAEEAKKDLEDLGKSVDDALGKLHLVRYGGEAPSQKEGEQLLVRVQALRAEAEGLRLELRAIGKEGDYDAKGWAPDFLKKMVAGVLDGKAETFRERLRGINKELGELEESGKLEDLKFDNEHLGKTEDHVKTIHEHVHAIKKEMGPTIVDTSEFDKAYDAAVARGKKARAQEMDEQFKAIEAERKANADAAAKYAKEWEAAEEKREKAHQKSLDEIHKAEKEHFAQTDAAYADFKSSTVEATLGDALSATQTYFNAVAAGHKQAAAEAEAAFLESIGNQLVGIGEKAILEGGELLLVSHGMDPAAYGLLTLGGAAIAAGVGMGAAGSSISAQVASADAAQKKDQSKPEVGIHGGSSSGGGGGSSSGPRTVTIVNEWGSSGPGADEYARSTVNNLVRATKRGYL